MLTHTFHKPLIHTHKQPHKLTCKDHLLWHPGSWLCVWLIWPSGYECQKCPVVEDESPIIQGYNTTADPVSQRRNTVQKCQHASQREHNTTFEFLERLLCTDISFTSVNVCVCARVMDNVPQSAGGNTRLLLHPARQRDLRRGRRAGTWATKTAHLDMWRLHIRNKDISMLLTQSETNQLHFCWLSFTVIQTTTVNKAYTCYTFYLIRFYYSCTWQRNY